MRSVGKRKFSVLKEVEYIANTVLQMFNTVIPNIIKYYIFYRW
jgi:hypothetical protein